MNPLWQLLAAVVASGLSYRLGVRQGRIAERSLKLTIGRATPRLGSRVELRSFHPDERRDITRYVLHTTIYNDGELAAGEVRGEWRLTASHGVGDVIRPIRCDTLSPRSPWVDEHNLGRGIGGQEIGRATIDLRLDLTYTGLDEEQDSYRAQYQYDREHGKMVQVEMRNS